MESSSKALEKVSKLIYYSISFILCIFLILLSSNVIDDIDGWSTEPQFESFKDSAKVSQINQNINKHQLVSSEIGDKMANISRAIELAQRNAASEKQSYDNWLQTRKTIGSPTQDKEVLERTKKLDDFYKVERAWKEQADILRQKTDSINNLIYKENIKLGEVDLQANELYNKAYKWYSLKVFLIRLLFVTPILALGIYFFMKYRKHKYWPLFMGFSFFALYAFFVGLVPYLPSYGGYIRYGVGIALTVGLGYYSINKIKTFIEKKQAELKTASSERAKQVKLETAEKALDKHFCPSCGKDFLIKNWDATNMLNVKNAKIDEQELYKRVTDYCRYCGLQLFKKCPTCEQKNFAHLPFCSNCGTDIMKAETV